MSFIDDAMEAGFSQSQAEFMDEMLAKYPHNHDMTEVDGLIQALDDIEGEEEE